MNQYINGLQGCQVDLQGRHAWRPYKSTILSRCLSVGVPTNRNLDVNFAKGFTHRSEYFALSGLVQNHSPERAIYTSEAASPLTIQNCKLSIQKWCLVSGVWCPVSGVRCQVSGTSMELGVHNSYIVNPNMVFGVRYLVFGVRCLVFGTSMELGVHNSSIVNRTSYIVNRKSPFT